MPVPTINYLTGVHFGVGSCGLLPEVLNDLGVNRPLMVTDRGLLDLGFVERPGVEPAAIFSDVQTNPDEESALAGVHLYREHDCDGVVALGGGSPIDCAKCIALLVTHPEPLEQYAMIRGGVGRITPDKPPVVAIPTTAGTGSEVGRAALMTMRSGAKLAVIGAQMIPDVAICDPALTSDLPPLLTAATGVDAISHCVETYCSPKFNPVADAIALDGLQRAWRNLPTAVQRGSDIAARGEMMMAALQGGLTFQKGLGLIHSLSHPLGALKHLRLHHGMLNAVFLPHVLRFNTDTCPDKVRRMAEVIGVGADVDSLIRACNELIQAIGLPTRLRDMGVQPEDFEGIPAAAVADHSTPTNPCKVTAGDCLMLLEAAF